MPSLKLMLAASECLDFDNLPYPFMLSPKVDGVRCAMIDGKGYSRKMLPHENLFFQRWCALHGQWLHGIDCEVVVGPPTLQHEEDDVFNRSSGPIGKISGEPDFTVWVFELWDHQGQVAEDRYRELVKRVAEIERLSIPRVQLLPQVMVYNAIQARRVAAEFREQGYEGSMGKHPRKPYKHGRSTLNEQILLKDKEWVDSEAQIIGWKQGTTNTNKLEADALGHAKRSSAKAGKVLKDTLGSWRCRNIYTGVEFWCPPGSQSEAEIKRMWDERFDSLGRVLTYKYQKIGTLKAPRFPGMKAFRRVEDLAPDTPTPFLKPRAELSLVGLA